MSCSQMRKVYADRLRQLSQLGLPTPLECGSVDNQTSDIAIEQVALDIECPIIDLRDGRTLYVVWLALVAERPGVLLYDYRFEPPWPDRNFETLPTFTESRIGEAYVLPNDLAYPRADVLNFRFGKTGWRLPCTRVEGVLCALSATPIPEEYRHGASIRVGLKFFGRSGQRLASTSVVLWADRWVEPAVTRSTAKPAVEVDEADFVVDARPGRSSLYEPSGWNDPRVADQQGPPPAVTVHERFRTMALNDGKT
jgi:hypothetical protein